MGDKKKTKAIASRRSQRQNLTAVAKSASNSNTKTAKKRRTGSVDESSSNIDEDSGDGIKYHSRPPRPPSSADPKVSASTARRSKRRTFAVDPNKPLQIIRPNDDIKARFGLGPKELSELMDALHEDTSDDPFAVRFDDLSSGPATPNSSQVVFTPRVSTALPNTQTESNSNSRNINFGEQNVSGGIRKKYIRNQKKPQSTSLSVAKKVKCFAQPNFTVVKRGSKYVEYDMDSGDEEFLEVILPAALQTKSGSSSSDLSINSSNSNSNNSSSSCINKSKKMCPRCRDPSGKKSKRGKNEDGSQCMAKSCINYCSNNGKDSPALAVNSYPFPTMINADLFEKMISILERELEVAKIFLKERIRADLQGLVTKNLIDDGYSSLIHVNEYLNPSADSISGKLSSSSRKRALASLEKAYEHSRGEDACLSRKASTSSIVSAAVAAASAVANGDLNAPDKMEDILATLSCPAPLAVLLSTVPRNSPRDTTHTSVEAAAVFTSTLNRSASQSSLASVKSDNTGQFQSLCNKRDQGGNASPRSTGSGGSSPRGSLRHEDTQTNSQYFTSEHLRELVPEEPVILVLARVFRFNRDGENSVGADSGLTTTRSSRTSASGSINLSCSIRSSRSVSSRPVEKSQELDPTLRLILSEVYNYWVDKRSCHLDSLLRCYHNFMMDEWHQAPSMPPLPEDFNIDQLKRGHKELHRLRFDLDRARLIVDRVRRRERIKKDLIKLSSDNFDKVLHIIEQTMDIRAPAPTTVKAKGVRHGSKKEIDRCKLLSTLPSMLKKRPFAIHPQASNSNSTEEVDSADDMDDSDEESKEDEKDSHMAKKSKKEATMFPSHVKKAAAAAASQRDVVVVSTGQHIPSPSSSTSPDSSKSISDDGSGSDTPLSSKQREPRRASTRHQEASTSSLLAPPSSPKRRRTGGADREDASTRRRSASGRIMAGRRISRASDEVNLTINEYGGGNDNSENNSKMNTRHSTGTIISTSSEYSSENNHFETNSTSSTTTSGSTNVRVPNGNRSSRGLVSIPKLKKVVADQNSKRALSSSPSFLSENQKWSNLAVKSAMKKVVVIPEEIPALKRNLRSVSSPGKSRSRPSPAKKRISRKGKKELSVSSEDDSCSSSNSSSSDEEEENSDESSLSPPPKSFSNSKHSRKHIIDKDSGKEQKNSRVTRGAAALRNPLKRRLLRSTPQRQHAVESSEEEEEVETEEQSCDSGSDSSSDSEIEHGRGRKAAKRPPAGSRNKGRGRGRISDGSISESESENSYSEDDASDEEQEVGSKKGGDAPKKTGRSTAASSSIRNRRSSSGYDSIKRRENRVENEGDENNLAASTGSHSSSTSSASASSSSSSSSVLSDPPGGFGSRAVKRGTYSPALCSLSGLARPFMSGGAFSSFKACFS